VSARRGRVSAQRVGAARAVGRRRGDERRGHLLPCDDSRGAAASDVSGGAFYRNFTPCTTEGLDPSIDGAGEFRSAYWLLFYGRRDCSNAQVGTRGTGRRQIWVSAISTDVREGRDASAVPYWLPGQEVAQQNASALCAPLACRPSDVDRSDNGECCSGDCFSGRCLPAAGATAVQEPVDARVNAAAPTQTAATARSRAWTRSASRCRCDSTVARETRTPLYALRYGRAVENQRTRTRLFASVSLLAAALGADACTPNAAPVRWECPAGWVSTTRGGCAPAALVCDTPEAAMGACTAALGTPPTINEPSGATHRGFARGANGEILGGHRASSDPMIPGADFQATPPASVPAADFAPLAPRMQCPMGWSSRAGLCDPEIRADCPAGSGALPSGQCTQTAASACPTGAFAMATAGETARYVLAGAPAGGDGSEARPFDSVTAALSAAPMATVLLLGEGAYSAVTLSRAITLRGRCPSSTRISAGASANALRVDSASARVEGVTLEGGTAAVHVAAGASLTLGRAIVRGATGYGVHSSGMLELQDAWIDAIDDRAEGSAGVFIEAGGATIARVSITDSARVGVRILADTTVRDSAMLRAGVRSMTGTLPAAGIEARNAAVTIERVAVVGSRQYGVLVADTASATASDLFVARTTGSASAGTGRGVDLEGSAQCTIRRLGCENNLNGCFLHFSRSLATLEDVVVRGGSSPFGLYFGGGTANVSRADVSGVAGTGVLATRGARATISDLVVHDSAAAATTVADVTAQNAGVLELSRVRLSERSPRAFSLVATGARSRVVLRSGVLFSSVASNSAGALEAAELRLLGGRDFGVVTSGAGSTLRLVDSIVDPSADNDTTARLGAEEMASLEVERVTLRARAYTGVVAGSRGRVRVRDMQVSDVLRPRIEADGAIRVSAAFGAAEGGQLEAERTRSVISQGVHWYAKGEGSVVTVREALARGTGEASLCLACLGAIAREGATVSVSRARLDEVTGTALGADSAARLEVRDTVVRAPVAHEPNTEAGQQFTGLGALVRESATGIFERVVIEDATTAGALVSSGASLLLRDCAVRRVRRWRNEILGWGVGSTFGGQLEARGLLVENAFEGGVLLAGNGATGVLEDAIVRTVAASARGLGMGVGVFDGATGTFDRVAIDAVEGIGLGVGGATSAAAGTARASDVFLRSVRPGTLAPRGPGFAEPQTASIGIISTRGTSLTASRITAFDAGYGVYNQGGTLVLRQGVVSGMVDALGAFEEREPSLVDVWGHGNANNGVRSNTTLGAVGFALPTGIGR